MPSDMPPYMHQYNAVRLENEPHDPHCTVTKVGGWDPTQGGTVVAQQARLSFGTWCGVPRVLLLDLAICLGLRPHHCGSNNSVEVPGTRAMVAISIVVPWMTTFFGIVVEVEMRNSACSPTLLYIPKLTLSTHIVDANVIGAHLWLAHKAVYHGIIVVAVRQSFSDGFNNLGHKEATSYWFMGGSTRLMEPHRLMQRGSNLSPPRFLGHYPVLTTIDGVSIHYRTLLQQEILDFFSTWCMASLPK